MTNQPDNPEILATEQALVPEPAAAVEPAATVEPELAPVFAPVEPGLAEPAADAVEEPVYTQHPLSGEAVEEGPAALPEPVLEAMVNPVQPPTETLELPSAPEPAADEAPVDEPVSEPAVDTAEPAVAVGEPESEPVAVAEPTAEPVQDIEATAANEPAAVPEPAVVPAPEASAEPKLPIKTRDDAADLSPFSVIVSQVYDGPLDLLLDLIRKQDIDIYDIPIARITSQFLAYVNQLKATDVDVAGEFIYIASLLIHIKSKMLLPRAAAGPDDAAEDPRRELVERLLEHERFKNAAQMLQQKQMLEAATWSNPGFREFAGDAAAEPEIAADTVDLVRIFRDILERARRRPVFSVDEDSVTVGQMMQFLARRLTMEDKPVALRRLLSHSRSERALVAMFLALLELVRLQAVLLRQDRAFSEIFIKKHTAFDAVMNEGLSNTPSDEWR